MSNVIITTHEMAEAEWNPGEEPRDVDTNMVATREPEGKGIEFHVSMRTYTQHDMEDLIVEAAARTLVGKIGDARLAKLLEERCISMVTQKVDAHLKGVTADIIDQPITPKYPFMKADEKPMTMREFIGLTGRDYLEGRVDSSGNPTTDRTYSKPRLQHLVQSAMERTFKLEMEKATNAALSEVQKEIRSRHEAMIAAEKKRLQDAMARLVGDAS